MCDADALVEVVIEGCWRELPDPKAGIVKVCGCCGKTYTASGWAALAFVGHV
jgi:hypothetical protein